MPAPESRIPQSTPTPSYPPEAWTPLVRLKAYAGRPLERFLHIEAASGIVLLAAAAIALAWANSPWAASYTALWQTPLGIRLGDFSFVRSAEWVVNDALMVIFFFVVGLEIRREIHQGELSEWRRAALPAVAALGGMLAPAALYLLLAPGANTRSGWAVPMATDIAFAVGILTLLGKRVPPALRVLLLALAVIDDLGAILVIALFYSSDVQLLGGLILLAALTIIVAMQRVGVRSKAAYIAPGVVAWAGIYTAGVHPTIAGVLIGLITPVRAWFGAHGFMARMREELMPLQDALDERELPAHALASTLRQVDVARREARSPAEGLIDALHPWVAFGIMPLFALANAGVSLRGVNFEPDSIHVMGAAFVGLVFGKPLGVLLATWLTLKLGITRLPIGLGGRHLAVLGTVAGVGFTMALFVAQLAFGDEALLSAAKLGVLLASGCAAVLTLVLGHVVLSPGRAPIGAATTADEAERSTVA